ncbi:hypothetical protein HOY80DRAFT_1034819 [Tuber brumale]|nr:hypothetical protein HOY80DRAFT_1034819 [Tuber brumale]
MDLNSAPPAQAWPTQVPAAPSLVSVGPSRTVLSRQSHRSQHSSNHSSHASTPAQHTSTVSPEESDSIACLLAEAGWLAALNPASFPTIYAPEVEDFSSGELVVGLITSQLLIIVPGLTASPNSLTIQVRAVSSGTIAFTPQGNHLAGVEVGLKDDSFQVWALPSNSQNTWVQVARKDKKGKKPAMAAQVATSNMAAALKTPPPLPATQQSFYAQCSSSAPFVDSFRMIATMPDVMATVLKEASSTLPLAFSASVNHNRAIALTANLYTSSSADTPFFEAMT